MLGSPDRTARAARVLVIVFNDLWRDPRVHRQLEALAGRHEVIVAGFGTPRTHVSACISLEPPLNRRATTAGRPRGVLRLASRRFDAAYWGDRHVRLALARLEGVNPDVVISNDINTLPLALRVAQGAPVVFDAHEYYPEHFAQVRWWRLLMAPHHKHLCDTYMPQANSVMTVSPGIAARYEQETGVPPQIILNAPSYAELEPSPVEYPIRLVHHGAADHRRRLGSMIEAMRYLDDRFTLDLILVDCGGGELARLKRLARGERRIAFRDPVPMPEIPVHTNRYDVGVYLLEPGNFNYLHALPNKLFEFVQARLCVVVGPSPDMEAVVRKHDLGRAAEDFSPESFARALSALTPETVLHHKQQAHAAARSLSAEHEQERVRTMVETAIHAQQV